MAEKQLTDAQKKLKEQFDRVPLDDELKKIIYEGLSNIGDSKAIAMADDLRRALDTLPRAIEYLKESRRKLGS